MEQPKLKCFLVTTQWPNVGSLDIFMASSSEMASAVAVMCAMRADPAPEGDLTNMLVREVSVEALRTLLTQLETGKPGTVVRLVPPREVDMAAYNDAVEAITPWPSPPDVPPGAESMNRQRAAEAPDAPAVVTPHPDPLGVKAWLLSQTRGPLPPNVPLPPDVPPGAA